MPSPSKPIPALSFAQLAVLGLAGVSCALAAWWAFRPLATPPIDATLPPTASVVAANAGSGRTPLDPAAFAVRLWTPSAEATSGTLANGPNGQAAGSKATAPGKAMSAPSTALRLQLIGILRDDTPDTPNAPHAPRGHGTLRAALYNPETDTLHIVASGERVGPHLVQAVEPAFVTIAAATGITTTLTLEPDSSAATTSPSSIVRPNSPRQP